MGFGTCRLSLDRNSDGMVYYNDVLYACMKRVYGNEDLVGVPKYLVKQEAKVRKQLDQLKKKKVTQKSMSRMTTANSTLSTQGNSGNPVNPIAQILFLGMTMKAWLNYSKKVGEKMKAARENGIEYLSSSSEEEESYESEESQESWSSENEIQQEEEEQDDILEEQVELKDCVPDDEGAQKESSPKMNLIESRLSPQSRERDDYKFVVHKEIPNLGVDQSLHVHDTSSPSKKIDSMWASDSPGEAGRIGTIKSLVDFWDAEKLSNISPVSRNDLGTFEPQENSSHLFGLSKIPIKEVLDSSPMASLLKTREHAAEIYEKAEKDQLSLPLSISRISRHKKGDNATPKSGGASVKNSSPSS